MLDIVKNGWYLYIILKLKTNKTMTTEIIKTSSSTESETIYTSFHLRCGTKEMELLVVRGKFNYVTSIVKNASHAAFKGMGKQFNNLDEACSNYKDAKIKAMINFAKGF